MHWSREISLSELTDKLLLIAKKRASWLYGFSNFSRLLAYDLVFTVALSDFASNSILTFAADDNEFLFEKLANVLALLSPSSSLPSSDPL